MLQIPKEPHYQLGSIGIFNIDNINNFHFIALENIA